MSEPSPFDTDPRFQKMRDNIADRRFKVKMTGLLISGALMVAALATMFILPAGALGAVQPILGLAMVAASGLTSLVTLKEMERLKLDEEYARNYSQGHKWWEGYREEVAEPGYDQGRSQAMFGGPSPQRRPGRAPAY